MPATRSLATALANNHGLDVFALRAAPDAAPMTAQRIAVFADEGNCRSGRKWSAPRTHQVR